MSQQNTCYLTGLNAEITTTTSGYLVIMYHEDLEIRYLIDKYLVKPTDKNHNYFVKNSHIIAGLLLNGRIPEDDVLTYWDDTSLRKTGQLNIKEVIETWDYPKTPKEKKDNLLNEIFNKTEFEGQEIDWLPDLRYMPNDPAPWLRLFFKEKGEAFFYLQTLKAEQLLQQNGAVAITYKGLNYLIKENEAKADNRKTCFIAMSFQDDAAPIRKEILEALERTGIEPRIIDNEHLEPLQTINDGIIAGIRKASFVIADFTHHRAGVYFEAGFALGLNKKVIYTCREEDFKDTHFDTNHYQHIVYKKGELTEKLIDKIEAWVLPSL